MADDFKNMKQKEVDGTMYDIYILPPKRALKLKTRLIKLFLPALGTLIPSGKLQDLFNKDLNIEQAIGLLSAQLEEDMVVDTVYEFLARVKKGNQQIDPEVEFLGNTTKMMKVFWAALEVNYEDFFVVLSGLLDRLGQATAPEKQASTG